MPNVGGDQRVKQMPGDRFQIGEQFAALGGGSFVPPAEGVELATLGQLFPNHLQTSIHRAIIGHGILSVLHYRI